MTDLHTFFEHVKHALHLPEDLQLKWYPGKSKTYHGLVTKDKRTVIIFDEDEETAKETLIHEVVEYLLEGFVAHRVNTKSREEQIKVRENLVEMLREMMEEESITKKGSSLQIARMLEEIDSELVEDE